MYEQQLRAATAAAGVDTDPFFSPNLIAQDVVSGAKRLARYLRKDFPAIGQRQALEVIGKASRLDGWHHLEATASHVLEATRPGEHSGHLYAIRHAFPLTHLAREVVWCYQLSSLEAMSSFADGIGKEMAVAGDLVRGSFARALGSETWDGLVGRRPESHPGPFYSFDVKADGRGEIRESMACAELRRGLREGWNGYAMANEADQHGLRNQLWRILKDRPDFLVGWSALIEMSTDDGDVERAEQLLREQIVRIEALIPAGFKGKLSNEGMGNNTYQSALYQYMNTLGSRGDFKAAIQAARKLKQTDERDSYGTEETLVLLHSLTGEHAKATPMIKRLEARRNDLPAETALMLAHCYFLRQEPERAVYWLMVALFKLPMVRPMLEGTRYRHNDPSLVRVSIPDTDEVYVRLEWVQRNHKPVIAMCQKVLDNQVVKDAELEMERRWGAARNGQTPQGIEQWFAAIPDVATAVSTRVPRLLMA